MLKFHALRVAEIRPEAEDAVALSLDVPEELRNEYRGLAGQHLVLKAQVDEEELRRTYTPVSAPGEWPVRIVARVHASGRFSRFLAEELRSGEHIHVLPPNGSFTPRRMGQGPGHYVAFASGSGITPVLPIARELLMADKGNRLSLFYGNGSTGRAMCLEELLGLKDRYLDRLSLHFVMSREPQEVELYNGRIDAARTLQFAKSFFQPESVREYFVCGPGDMIEQVTATLRGLGVEADRIHAEYFTLAANEGVSGAPSGVESSGREPDPASAPREMARSDQADVTVIMDGRRRSFTMRMNDESILDAAARAGIELPFSCRAGVCSTCRTKVVRGEVEMAQNYALEDWELEQGYVLACQSHAKTPVLELDYDEK
jgi:ring-1,2-phenylacetyl-CoA epoxidase subunit PaaE